MNLTVCVIAKDEKESLPNLAEALKPLVEAGVTTILLDNGSRDGTADLARSLGFEVHEAGDGFMQDYAELHAANVEALELDGKRLSEEGTKVFDFSAARNYCASLADTDWILVLDCDEVPIFDIEALETALLANCNSYKVRIDAGNTSWSVPRLYRSSKTSFTGIVHEVISAEGSVNLIEQALSIRHNQVQKDERPKRIAGLAVDAFQRPDNARALYYFGRELSWRGFHNMAIKYLTRASEIQWWKPEKAQALIFKGDSLKALGRIEDALESYRQAVLAAPSRRVGNMRLSEHYFSKADWNKVIVHAEAALTLPLSGHYIEDMNEYGYRPHWLLYPAYWQTGNRELSRFHYEKARELAPNDRKILADAKHFGGRKISIVIPTLGREDKLNRCLDAIEKNAEWPDLEIVIEQDSFDNRRGCPKTLAEGVRKSTGDFVMFLGNDCIPQEGFIGEAMKVMDTLPDGWGLVALYDKRHQGAIATHWIASKKLLPYLDGYFFHPDYEHCFSDVELTERAKLLGRYAYAPLSVVVHDNAIVDGGERDDVLKIAYEPGRLKRDRATYERRKKIWSLPFTGERVVPDKMDGYEGTLKEHLARYRFAQRQIVGRTADMACGAGYGTEMLGADGYDVSEQTLEYARARYGTVNFFCADLSKPDIKESYDTVVSFETIEHLDDPKLFIEWVKVHAKRFVFSIPVDNPSSFHRKVYSVEQIRSLVAGLGEAKWYSQTGTSIVPLEEGDNPTFVIGVIEKIIPTI